jgi:hypothetical protein
MRYIVTARVREGKDRELLDAIDDGSLGQGSVAGDEYQANMEAARLREDGSVRWVKTCFCETPLEEERPYWEKYFELVRVRDAHPRTKCRDANGSEPWACCGCDCTRRLEEKLAAEDTPFLQSLRETAG